MLLPGCGNTDRTEDSAQKEAAVPTDPDSAGLHARLFDAADRLDIDGFKGLLTRSSIAMFETHFEAVATLPRAPGANHKLGWTDVLRFHANLDSEARARTPYPVVEENGQKRLDAAGHADARFYEAVATRLLK